MTANAASKSEAPPNSTPISVIPAAGAASFISANTSTVPALSGLTR